MVSVLLKKYTLITLCVGKCRKVSEVSEVPPGYLLLVSFKIVRDTYFRVVLNVLNVPNSTVPSVQS